MTLSQELENAPTNVKDFFKRLDNNGKFKFIEYEYGDKLTYGGFEVILARYLLKGEIYINDCNIHYYENDIIEFSIAIDEEFEDCPVFVEKIGQIGGVPDNTKQVIRLTIE